MAMAIHSYYVMRSTYFLLNSAPLAPIRARGVGAKGIGLPLVRSFDVLASMHHKG